MLIGVLTKLGNYFKLKFLNEFSFKEAVSELSRGCTSPNDQAETGCQNIGTPEVSHTCYIKCNKDSCNGTGKISSSFGLMIFLFATIIGTLFIKC